MADYRDMTDGDAALARALQEESRQAQRQADEVAAVRQQRNEEWQWQGLQREDTKFAKSLYNEELAARFQDEQNDEELARRLQQFEEEEMEQDQTEPPSVAVQLPEEPPVTDGQLNRDSQYAAELRDREVAYQLQLQLDKQMAERLAENVQPGEESGAAQRDPEIPDAQAGAWNHPFVSGATFLVSQPRRPNRVRGALYHGRGKNRRADRPAPARDDSPPNIPDPDDYEANWELAERLGEVKDRSLKKDLRRTLPVCMYTGAESGDSEEDRSCKVCLCNFEKGEVLQTLPCLHKYHKSCIEKWFDTHSTCPICNLDVKEELSKH